MKLFDKFEIINSFPALYLKKENAVVISDLHLGLESLMAEEGVYFPKFQLKEMKEDLKKILDLKEPEKLVINGDIKHEFSETTWEEREEVRELLDFLSENVNQILLVKGNHDNYLIYAVKDYDNVELEEKVVLEDVCFIHGDEDIDLNEMDEDFLIIGHEHPALVLKDDLGIKEKVRCFLYGEVGNKKMVVMPALSKFARGSQVNQIPKERLLSPFLKKHGIGSFKAIAVSKEGGIYKFPEVRKI